MRFGAAGRLSRLGIVRHGSGKFFANVSNSKFISSVNANSGFSKRGSDRPVSGSAPNKFAAGSKFSSGRINNAPRDRELKISVAAGTRGSGKLQLNAVTSEFISSEIKRGSHSGRRRGDVIKLIIASSRDNLGSNAGIIINASGRSSGEPQNRAAGLWNGREDAPSFVISNAISNSCAAISRACKERVITTI